MLNLLSLNSATKLHYLIWNNIQYRDIQNCLISTFQNFVLGIDAMLCWLGTSATLLRYKVKIPKVIISDTRCLKFNWRFVIFLWNMLIMSVIVVYVCQNCVTEFFSPEYLTCFPSTSMTVTYFSSEGGCKQLSGNWSLAKTIRRQVLPQRPSPRITNFFLMVAIFQILEIFNLKI